MGNAIRNLSLTQSGYVRADYPTTVFPTNSGSEYVVTSNAPKKIMYFMAEQMPDSIKYRRLYDMRIRMQVKGIIFYSYTNKTGFNPSTLCYENAPEYVSLSTYGRWYLSGQVSSQPVWTDDWLENSYGSYNASKSSAIKYAISQSIQVYSGSSTSSYVKTVLSGGGRPYLEITYDDSIDVKSKIEYYIGPKDGAYSDPKVQKTFGWSYGKALGETYSCAANFEHASGTLFWKQDGGEWNEIALSNTTPYITSRTANYYIVHVPANTFPVGETITWYIQGTDKCGTTTQTPQYTFSTASAQAVATCVSPINVVEDGSQSITFKWNIATADGSLASRVCLFWKLPAEADDQWHEIIDVNEHITQYTVDGDYFSGGEVQWLVRAYNVDGTAGPESIASFIVLNAPTQPIVSTNNAPFTTIEWQAEGQESYEIQIADRHYGPFFGTEKTFTAPDYLEDGEYVAMVRIMGVYGLWSSWGEVPVLVRNESQLFTDLSARVNIDAELIWSDLLSDDYLVYRDGVQIARTTEPTFTDRTVLGSHDYYIISRYESGHYIKSKTITKTEYVDCLHIALLEGGAWLKVEHTLKSTGDPKFTETIATAYNQLSGHRFPVVEISEFEDVSAEYSAVFFYTEEHERQIFVSMFGKPVILKTPDDEVMIGVLEAWQRAKKKNAYTGYTFTIRRIDWSDYIDVS